jgi:hypothetical protein
MTDRLFTKILSGGLSGKVFLLASVSVVTIAMALSVAGPGHSKAKNPCAPNNPASKKTLNNPLNPCAPGHIKAPDAVHGMNPKAAQKAYGGLQKDMVAAFSSTGDQQAANYQSWKRYNTAPYESTEHGDRYLNNYANKIAQAYGKYEKSGNMPVGSVLAKDSFTVLKTGEIYPGPLFLMEKMSKGFMPSFGDWKYTMYLPDGSLIGETGGEGSENVDYCGTCHARVGSNQDHMFFLPKAWRLNQE